MNANRRVDSSLKPEPAKFIFKKREVDCDLLDCRIAPKHSPTFNSFLLSATLMLNNGPLKVKKEIDYRSPIELIDFSEYEGVSIAAHDLFAHWSNGYDIDNESKTYFEWLRKSDTKPSVAFTILNSNISGGGPTILFRYANWLVDLGVDVSIYSDTPPPSWENIKTKFHHIPNEAKRYAAISEMVVIVYSIFELPALLKHASTKGKRIFHLCQGVEDFHYGLTDHISMSSPKPIFEILNSLPVGRIGVSHHINNYFFKNYDQKVFTILNGIDDNIFRPTEKQRKKDELNILLIANPLHPLKGTYDTVQALEILQNRHPDWRVKCKLVSNQKINFDHQNDFFSLQFFSELTPREIRNTFHESDIFVNSSWYEGFGLPSIEAMACGIPVITTDNKGLDGIAKDRENCLIVRPQAPAEIADAIEVIRNNNDLRERLIRVGIETAAEHSISNQFAMFSETFEEILGIKFDPVLLDDKKCELADEDREKTFFTVIVPTYNQAKYLPLALDSLLAQTYGNWEAVIINDGSTDNTAEVAERYVAKDKRFRLVNKENGGCASALNEGLKNATGEWICWLSSDDLFEPEKLAVHNEAINHNKDSRFFFTSFYYLNDRTGEKNAPEYYPFDIKVRVIKLLTVNYIHGNSICAHRSVFDDVGPFNEKLKYAQDFDMWLRVCAKYPSVFISERTCVTRFHDRQTTNSFPEGGMFDTAAACIEFINNHTFSELFPLLDLTRKEDVTIALVEAFQVSINQSAWIHNCGYTTVVLERTAEWLSRDCGAEIREYILPEIEAEAQILNSRVSAEIKEAIREFQRNSSTDYSFVPHHFIDEIKGFIKKSPQNSSHRAALIRYLDQNVDRIKKAEELNREGERLIMSGNSDEALRSFKAALEEAPDHSPAHNNLAVLYSESGDNDKALYHFEKAFRNNGCDRSLVLKYADLLEKLHKIRQVRTVYADFLELNSDDEEVLILLEKTEDILRKRKLTQKAKQKRKKKR